VQLHRFVEARRQNDSLAAAVDWMWLSILHQGSIYSASPPVMWILADLLAADPNHPAAAAILGGLATLAEGCGFMANYDDAVTIAPVRCNPPGAPAWEVFAQSPLPHDGVADPSEDYFAACRVRLSSIQDTVAHAVPIVAHCIDHPDANISRNAAAAWWQITSVMPDAPDARDRLRGMIGNARHEPGVWLSAIIGLDLLGENVVPLIRHADRRIRLGAAMAKGTMGQRESLDELVSALGDLEWLERTFPKGLAHKDMRLRFHIRSALLERCSPTMADPTIIGILKNLIVQHGSPLTANVEWGPILRWAFPERLAKLPIRDEDMLPLPKRLDAAQRTLLEALTKNDDIWNPRMGNANLAFRYVQLPHDRSAILRCLAAAS
jgi:hypothetical protein